MAVRTSDFHADPRQSNSVAAIALTSLVVVDLIFIFCHFRFSPSQTSFWNVEFDGGYGEKFQHLKWMAASIMLIVLGVERRAAIYIGWAIIFVYFLVDDATMIHEHLGKWLATTLRLDRIQQIYMDWFPDLFLRPRDFGELAVALLVAAMIAVILAVTWPRHGFAAERRVSKRLIVWLGLFAIFSVGVDLVHIWALDPTTGSFSPAGRVLGLIEDGGEMICVSLLVGGLVQEVGRTLYQPSISLDT